MDKKLASKIIKSSIALDKALGRLDVLVSIIPDAEERKEFASNLGDIIGLVNKSFIRPIVHIYPDLDPD